MSTGIESKSVRVPLDPFNLDARLLQPSTPRAGVVIADGSGAGTGRAELRAWADAFATAGYAALLVDLLTGEEQPRMALRRDRPDVAFMAGRLVVATDFLLSSIRASGDAAGARVFYVTTGSATAAALIAATERPADVRGIVSWAGRPELAERVLPVIERPVLFLTPKEARRIFERTTRAAQSLTSAVVEQIDRRSADAAVPALAIAWIDQQLQQLTAGRASNPLAPAP